MENRFTLINFIAGAIVLLALLAGGLSSQGCVCGGASQSVAAPASPALTYYRQRGHVWVFEFDDPAAAPGTGAIAANFLHRELVRQRLFARVSCRAEPLALLLSRPSAARPWRSGDLIITGKLLYYLAGSSLQSSRADLEIQAFRTINDQLTEVWRTSVVEIGHPLPYRDYFLFQSPTRPAPNLNTLLHRAAQTACRELRRDMAGHNKPLPQREFVRPQENATKRTIERYSINDAQNNIMAARVLTFDQRIKWE